MLLALLALTPSRVLAQPDRFNGALASLPDASFATQAWSADRSSYGFVYLLGVTGEPRGTIFRPFVHDLGHLRRADVARALSGRVVADTVVDSLRSPSGDLVAYVVRHRDVQVYPAFHRDGSYTLYVRAGEASESGGSGAGGGAGGGGM